MSQHDYSIANQGFPATRSDINNVLSAISTNNSGTSAPSSQFAGQFWIDTTSSTWTLYIHDGSDDIQFATIDTSANTVNFIDSELGDNSVTTAKIADDNVTSAKLVYPLTTFSSTGIDDNATSTAITIDSSENVGINTSSPETTLHVKGSDRLLSPIRVESTNASGTSLISGRINATEDVFTLGIALSSTSLIIGNRVKPSDSSETDATGYLSSSDNNTAKCAIKMDSDGDIKFYNASASATAVDSVVAMTERMRIELDGTVLVGMTAGAPVFNDEEGIYLSGGSKYVQISRNEGKSLYLNRKGDDGSILGIYQAGTEEGTISVAGSTVSYNGFTGTHWSRFQDNSTPTILRGTVLESLDKMCNWYNLEFDVTDENENTHTEKVPHVLLDGQSNEDIITYNHEGTDYQATIVKEADIKHMMSKISDTVDAKNVYGLFVAYDLDGEGYNDFYVASVGSYVVRIKSGQTITKGDLLQSNGDGTAKVQTDDNIKSSSFAKVLSTTKIETYDDGSYLVPCSLMC